MAKRPTKKAKSEAAAKLAEALNFVAPAYKEGDEAYKVHARMAGKMLTASDGVFTAGHAVEEELALCPHIGRLIDALNRAGSTLTLTATENGTLLVKGDRIRATVPCIPGDALPQVMPDARVAAIDDRLKEGFAALLPLIDHEGERVIEVSIMLQANSMIATNGYIIFEYWHGIDLPPGLVVPKTFAAAVAGTAKKLDGFGFSDKSVTFYFEDGSWYKSQLYGDKWPDIAPLFDYPNFPAAVPEGLFDAVKAIESFSKDGRVHFHEDKVKTTYDKYEDNNGPLYGATYDVLGLQAGHSFTAKLLRKIEPVCKEWDYTSNPDRAFFLDGGNLRGSIMKVGMGASEPAPPPVDWGVIDRFGAALAPPAEEPAQEAPQPVQAGGWGVPNVQSYAEAAAIDASIDAAPVDPWAAIVNPLGIEDEDIPF